METQNEILNELAALNSPLATMSRTMPHQVPGGYFEDLSNNVKDVLAYEEDHELDVEKTVPYEVPTGYFDLLPSVMMDAVRKEDNLQTVPEGYFESLPGNIIAAIKAEERPADTIALPKKRKTYWKSISWAAAAIVILAFGLIGYNAYNADNLTPEQSLAKISTSTVDEYIATNIDDFEAEDLLEDTDLNELNKAIKTELDENEILDYLKETGGGGLN